MKKQSLPIWAAIMLMVGLVFSGMAAAPKVALAADNGDEISWTSPWLCATTRPDVCEDVQAPWSWTAPSDGTVTLTVGVQSVNTGPDAAEVLDYETSWGTVGRLGTVGYPSSFEATIEVAEGEDIWVHFSHPMTQPGGSVQATVRGHFEPTPAPIEPECGRWSVSPDTGYAPLEVSGSGSYTDPDGLVEEVRIVWGDGSVTTNPNNLGNVPHSYEVGTHQSQLVLVKADGGLVTSAACAATVEAVEPPVETFEVEIGASCEDQVLSGLIKGSASQIATLNVTAEAFGTELSGSQQVGPGAFEFTASKTGIEGLVEVVINATIVYQDGVAAEDHYSAVLDCGLPPLPEPGACIAAAVNVANVPDSGAMVAITAQVVGDLAEVSVNGQPAGQAVPVNGTATFEIFVHPDDQISVAARGEDGTWATSPACQLKIAGEPERCPNSFVTAYVYYDESRNGLWEAGNSVPTLGTLDWQSAGEPGLNGVSVVVPTDSGQFSGTTQPNGWAFTTGFYSSVFFAQPIGGYASDGSPLPFIVNGETWEVSGVATLATDGTGTQTPVTSWPLEEGGHCGARVFLIGLVPAQPVAEAVPAWGGNAPADQIAAGAEVVGSVTVGGQTVEMTEVWGSDTSDWHQCGLRRDRQLIGCHVTDNTGQDGPGTALLGHQVGDTITVTVDGVTTTYVVTGRSTVDRGPDWANRLDQVEAMAGGSAMTFFTCSGWTGAEYSTFTVLTTAPAG